MVGQGKSCRFLYSNIRGLHSNLRDLTVASRNSDVVLCVETLVSNRRHSCEVAMSRFAPPVLLLKDSIPNARGLALYVRRGFSAYRQSRFECKCHEIVIVRICSRHHNFYVFCLYRNPHFNDNIYDCLLTSMASVQSADRKASFIFVGDFNAHHQEWLRSVSATDEHGRAALHFSEAAGCEQLVNEPTHVHGNRLDLLLTDVPGLVSVEVLGPIGTSDHSALSVKLQLSQSFPEFTVEKEVFLKNRVDWDRVALDVRNMCWTDIFASQCPVSALNTGLLGILRRRVPVRKLRIRSNDKPWFDAECRGAYDLKQTAYREWSRDRSVLKWNNFLALRTRAEQVYDDAEERYNTRIRTTLAEASQPHKWWSTLKSATLGTESSIPPLNTRSGVLESDPSKKAELLMDSFNAKQSNNIINLPPTCHPNPVFCKFAFRSKQVFNLLCNLDSYGGTDPLGFFPLFYKKIASVLAPKLSVIFRKLLKVGSFPTCWRTANVTPIPKGPSSPNVADYRPISITPVLSKIYEKLIANPLSKFCESSGLFPPNQFAYRKGLGTCDCLLSMTHQLQSELDQGCECRMVLIDFSAAFDRVNHLGLLYKLSNLGIGGSVQSVISEFLTQRNQRVVVDGRYSRFVDVVSGVPQGSVLGPLLFILYTSDMFAVVDNRLYNYADDSTLVATIRSPADRIPVANSLNADLHKIEKWCSAWDMTLNARKTKTIVIGRSRTNFPMHPELSVGDRPLEESHSVYVLGVTLDAKLTFEQQVRNVVKSASQKLGIVRKASSVFGDRFISSTVFRSFVLPLLEYCSPVWGSAADTHLELLNRIARVPASVGEPGDLQHRRNVGALSMFYKIVGNASHSLHHEVPPLRHFVRVTRESLATHERARAPVRCRTSQFARCFVPGTVRLWNSLDAGVFESGSIGGFKSSVNRFFRS